ncbi:MAG: hypothetical protein Q9181_006176 [Wetmoreana brouardii]
MPYPNPQYYHHCLDRKHKFYQFCCETPMFPDCDGVHGPKNPVKPGHHSDGWEAGPPPPNPEEEEGDDGKDDERSGLETSGVKSKDKQAISRI